MGSLQVLVVTMHQKDLAIAEKMNIRCPAVFANQADRNEIIVEDEFKMITTNTRGVGLNRNIAMLAADADILLFADDDVVYNDDMPESVLAAFRDNPKADVLVFGMDMIRNGHLIERRHLTNRRLRVWNSMRFGTYRIAVRRSRVLQHNLTFNQNFGGGCPFSAGEDSLFLKACFDAGLKVYANEYVLGNCAKDTSTWFVGYNKKYFYDKGVLIRYLFPKLHSLMVFYFGIRFKRKTDLNVFQRMSLMLAGIRGGKELLPYEE